MQPEDEQRRRQQRLRSIAIGWVLFGMVVLFYVVTLVRFGRP